jgi:hypothetical protein
MTMIALGGSIGTGLFLASGGAVAEAGPGGCTFKHSFMKLYFMSGQEPEGGGVYKSKDRREYAIQFHEGVFERATQSNT